MADSPDPSSSAPLKFLRVREVAAIVGLSRGEIYRRMALGSFPKNRRLSPKFAVWLSSDIEAWQHDEIAKADRR